MRKEAWHAIVILPESKGSPTNPFNCTFSGHDCLTHLTEGGEGAFLHPKMKKELQDETHDDTLFQVTDEMNRLLTEVSSKNPDKHLMILDTSRGLLVIWTAGPATPGESYTKPSDSEILDLLGLKHLLNNKEARYILEPHTTPGLNEGPGHWHCVTPGGGCIAPLEGTNQFFLKPNLSQDKLNQIQDDSLSQVTDEFNYKLAEAARTRPDRELRIVKISLGLVLIWCSPAKHDMKDQPKLDDKQILELLGLSS